MIAAQRTLFIRTDAAPVEVLVTVEVPVLDRDAWVCGSRIGWPGEPYASVGMGYDSMRALFSALGNVALRLYMSSDHKAGTLYFDEPGEGYGFWMPAAIRDLAIGQDRAL